MPSNLSIYPGCASGRRDKFVRAVNSFLKQTHHNKELVIVADGCEKTEALYHKHYFGHREINFIKTERQPLFSGNVRQTGLDAATGQVVFYLDVDDYLNFAHLEVAMNNIHALQKDWVWFSDYIKTGNYGSKIREIDLSEGCASISNIAHKKSVNVSWTGCDGRGHGWDFIKRLMKASDGHAKIYGCGYIVCHEENGIDL